MIPGDAIPAVELLGVDGPIALDRYRGKPFVIYFYPRDDTPGCTREALDFTALASAFAVAGAALLGVSKDSPTVHAKFVAKHGLTVPLASDDAANTALQAFGVWREKTLYGRSYMGIERSTFLFDADGRLARSWRKVKVAGHAAEVLSVVQALSHARDSLN